MRRPLFATCVAALAVLLCACSDSDAADPPASPDSSSASDAHGATSSHSQTAAPSATAAPSLPEAATAGDYDGAVAFVEHYIDVFNYAQTTGDTEGFRALGAPECESCLGIADAIDGVYGGGGSATGGEIPDRRSHFSPPDHGSDYGVFLPAEVSPQEVTRSTGEHQQRDGGSIEVYSYPYWTGSEWQMLWFQTVDVVMALGAAAICLVLTTAGGAGADPAVTTCLSAGRDNAA